MKKFKLVILFFIFTILIVSTHSSVKANEKEDTQVRHIMIDKTQIKDENIKQINKNKTSEILIDDQDLIPEYQEEKMDKEQFDKIKSDTWYPSYSGTNSACYIDFKTTYKISYIAIKDTFGVSNITFEYGVPFLWKEIITIKTDEFNTWRLFPIDEIETQFIHIKINNSTDSGISEIAFYGYKTGEEKQEEVQNEKPNFGITAEHAIGMNGFIDDPLDVLKAGGFLREYHNFSWTLDKIWENKFHPSYGGKWDFDSYYKMLKEADILVAPCIQGASQGVFGKNRTGQFKPVMEGEDTYNPESYKVHASTMFQYVARYGKNKIDESRLLLAEDQEKVSGLNYIQYYENGNEPDKTWEGDDGYFSPYELAAMCSADYDGHEKTIGEDVGIKNADEDSKLVMAGLANSPEAVKYLDLMNHWAKYNRKDGKLPLDVINFHYYSGKGNPEDSNLREVYTNIVNWRNQNAKDKEVWVTEFGWDSTESSKIGVKDNATQRDWIIRSYLLGFACGVDRQAMYMSRDASWVGDPGTYATSGLTTQKGAWTKKESWYGVSSLKNILTGFVFDSVIQETDELYIYKFINTETEEECYAVWSPTSDGSSIQGYELQIGNNTKATLAKLTNGYYDSNKERLKINNGIVKVDVTETPQFIMVNDRKGEYIDPSNTKIPININNVNTIKINDEQVEQQIKSNYQKLFDEQDTAPNLPKVAYKKEINGEFRTGWGETKINKKAPYSCYIDFGENYEVSHIGIYDTYSVGTIKLYAGTPDNWDNEPFVVLQTNTYNYWKVVDAVTNTRYVKIEKEDDAKLLEMAFYGFSETQKNEDPNFELNKEVLLGDINQDGAIDIIDLSIINKSILGNYQLSEVQKEYADINEDGCIDIVDLSIINKKILAN